MILCIRSQLFKNILYLGIVQISNLILPLISIPYVSRIIGPENFGLSAHFQNIVSYFTLIINFGFDLSATRLISIHRNDVDKISRIFFNVFYAKLFLFIFLTILTAFFINNVLIVDEKFIFSVTYITLIGNVLLPMWFYQGLEKLNYVALMNFISRLGYTLIIFILLENRNDFYIQNLSLSIINILSGVSFFLFGFISFRLSFIPFRLVDVFHIIIDSFPFFISSILQNIYSLLYIFLVGILCTRKDLGIFVAAQKVSFLFQTIILYSFSQALFPYFSKLLNENIKKGLYTLKQVTPIVLYIIIIGSLIIYFFSNSIIVILYGKEFYKSIPLLRIMILVPFFITFNYFICSLLLLNLKMYKEYTFIIISGLFISILFTTYFTILFSLTGTIIGWLVAEVTMSALGLYILKKNALNFIDLRYFYPSEVFNTIKTLSK